jgi:uncharacterized membrane protein
MWNYLQRSFIAGFFVIVPLAVSVLALVWIFRTVDGLTAPLVVQLIGTPIPGLGIALTAAAILVVGVFAANVIGRRLLQRTEYFLMLVPLFRSIYAPVKQLVWAFNPQNESGFKRVVMVEDPHRGLLLGFLTREFTAVHAGRAEPYVAVYVPTNHLYLGDVFLYPRARVSFPDLTVEDGVRIFLTGGMALPSQLDARGGTGLDDPRVSSPPGSR